VNRIVRIVLFAGLSSPALGISAAHAAEHETAAIHGDGRQASWEEGEGEHWHDRRDDHRRWERREERRREELRREWLWHHRFDHDGEWRR
jgi:hypothetical protein